MCSAGTFWESYRPCGINFFLSWEGPGFETTSLTRKGRNMFCKCMSWISHQHLKITQAVITRKQGEIQEKSSKVLLKVVLFQIIFKLLLVLPHSNQSHSSYATMHSKINIWFQYEPESKYSFFCQTSQCKPYHFSLISNDKWQARSWVSLNFKNQIF